MGGSYVCGWGGLGVFAGCGDPARLVQFCVRAFNCLRGAEVPGFLLVVLLVSLQKVSQGSVAQALLGCAGDFLCLEACDFAYVCALPFCSSHCVWLSMARQQSVARALLGYARGSGAGVGV